MQAVLQLRYDNKYLLDISLRVIQICLFLTQLHLIGTRDLLLLEILIACPERTFS